MLRVPIEGRATKNTGSTVNTEIFNPYEIVRRLIHGFAHRQADFCGSNIEGSYHFDIAYIVSTKHGEQQSCVDIRMLTIKAKSFNKTRRAVTKSRNRNIDPSRCV